MRHDSTRSTSVQRPTLFLFVAVGLAVGLNAQPSVSADHAPAQLQLTSALQPIYDAYRRRDFAAVNAALTATDRLGPPLHDLWALKYDHLGDDVTRRLGLMALELSAAALSRDRAQYATAAYSALDHVSNVLREHGMIADTDRRWALASVALLEGMIDPNGVTHFVDVQRQQFPTEARLVLARAIVLDQRTSPLGLNIPPARQGDAADAYIAATELAPVAAEAHVRLGLLYDRMGKHAEALTEFEAFRDEPHDATVAYWASLFRGRELDDLDRPADAERAYREALTISPGAQSARLGLMTLLAMHGRADEARALATLIEADTVASDPWSWYWEADYRAFAGLDLQLRRDLK